MGNLNKSIIFLLKKLLNYIRNFLNFSLRYPYVKYGKNVHVQWNVDFYSADKKVVIGDNVGINSGSLISSNLIVGNDVLIAPRCGFINRGEHTYDVCEQTIFDGPRARSEDIIIGDDVWVGYGSTILGGVTIGEGAIIAAGSLVLDDIPEYSIVAGSPAKIIKMRFDNSQISLHKKMLKKRYEKK